jgi:hypothetical protein
LAGVQRKINRLNLTIFGKILTFERRAFPGTPFVLPDQSRTHHAGRGSNLCHVDFIISRKNDNLVIRRFKRDSFYRVSKRITRKRVVKMRVSDIGRVVRGWIRRSTVNHLSSLARLFYCEDWITDRRSDSVIFARVFAQRNDDVLRYKYHYGIYSRRRDTTRGLFHLQDDLSQFTPNMV